ncbi:hypothetical protein OS493_031472, partial [Desmophyllum pertusum]
VVLNLRNTKFSVKIQQADRIESSSTDVLLLLLEEKSMTASMVLDRHAKEKLMNQQKSGDGDHYVGPKKKLFKQTTKKLNCPATVVIRETLRFPDYKVAGISQRIDPRIVGKIHDLVGDGVRDVKRRCR